MDACERLLVRPMIGASGTPEPPPGSPAPLPRHIDRSYVRRPIPGLPSLRIVDREDRLVVMVTAENSNVDSRIRHASRELAELSRFRLLETLDGYVVFLRDAAGPQGKARDAQRPHPRREHGLSTTIHGRGASALGTRRTPPAERHGRGARWGTYPQ